MSSLVHSPFRDKLNSFFVPTEHDMDEIRSLLIGPSAESTQLDFEIATMEAALVQLKSRRDAVNEEIAVHKSLLAPIRRIPQHALEEIFLACLPTMRNASIDPSQAPLLFRRVCRYWRELADRTPTLWSAIHIPGLDNERTDHVFAGGGRAMVPSSPDDVRAAFSGVVAKWLSRAASSPLSISFSESCGLGLPGEAPAPTAELVVPLVHAVSERIKRLDISADLLPWQQVLALEPQSLPELRHVQFMDWGSGFTEKVTLDKCDLLRHPNLRTVSLNGFFRPLDLPCHWDRLFVAQRHLHNTESRCTQLVRTTLELSDDLPLTWTSSSSLTVPKLEELTLGLAYIPHGEPVGSINEGLVRLVQLLILPKLRHLQIGNTFLIGPHPPPLQHGVTVSFIAPLTDPGARRDILREFPDLSALYVDFDASFVHPANPNMNGFPPPPPDNGLFAKLDEEKLCPELRFLTIKTNTLTIAHTGLVSFLASRPSIVASLNMRSAGRLDVEEELLKLRDERGCPVSLHYPAGPVPRKWRYNSRDAL
ncbi:F-box domain-containing protein [Mycena kentingensis (nom. inval.)]|nr:F-box domain-containing protein [Mycena kentingensis (nom. inval.)]